MLEHLLMFSSTRLIFFLYETWIITAAELLPEIVIPVHTATSLLKVTNSLMSVVICCLPDFS